MRKFILKRLLPFLKRDILIDVEYTTGKLHCVTLTVYVAGFKLIDNEICKVRK